MIFVRLDIVECGICPYSFFVFANAEGDLRVRFIIYRYGGVLQLAI